ncbi:unnamed protein product [Cylicostephanus goldi]|uniref:G-protein coupled receptors family 1 profile domain-containing protein n=1 Tax=Cylicostephanus goldi TaxID=71465 RepID=A0A3P7MER9_CYLGO|nr:unnamed protein product [Cylicostephanus goldi]
MSLCQAQNFAMSNNVVNPLLYAWLNPTFRKLVVSTIFGSVAKRGSSRMINRPWVYRSLPPKSQTEKKNNSQTPVTAETLMTNVPSKLKELSLVTNEYNLQTKQMTTQSDSKLIEYDDGDTFV